MHINKPPSDVCRPRILYPKFGMLRLADVVCCVVLPDLSLYEQISHVALSEVFLSQLRATFGSFAGCNRVQVHHIRCT